MDLKAIGERIAQARPAAGIETQQELATRLAKRLGKKITRQSVQQWESGKHPPGWDKLPALAIELKKEEEWIMFGERRSAQIAGDKRFLASVSTEEADLLTAFRSANPAGQAGILATARALAREHPAPMATLHPMRRRDDIKQN